MQIERPHRPGPGAGKALSTRRPDPIQSPVLPMVDRGFHCRMRRPRRLAGRFRLALAVRRRPPPLARQALGLPPFIPSPPILGAVNPLVETAPRPFGILVLRSLDHPPRQIDLVFSPHHFVVQHQPKRVFQKAPRDPPVRRGDPPCL